MEADNEDERVENVGCAPPMTHRGFESEVFTLSKNVRRKRLEGQTACEGLVDTSMLPERDYFNLRFHPRAFKLEVFDGFC